MRLGLAAYSLRDHLQGKLQPAMTLDDFIEQAARWNVDAVELTSYYFPQEITAAYVNGLKRHCHLLGIDVSTTPIRNVFTHPAGEAREKEIAHVKRWLDIASDLGSPAIRIFAGDAQAGQDAATGLQNVADSIELCLEHAAQRGVILALENHGGVVAEPEALLDVVKRIGSPWFGINFDSGNFHGEYPYAQLATIAPFAMTAQFKVEIQPKGKPKEEADFARIAKILKDAGYRGYATLEYEAAEAPLAAIPRWLEKLRAVL
jgi:sugar phosphate isomerase/epimerase